MGLQFAQLGDDIGVQQVEQGLFELDGWAVAVSAARGDVDVVGTVGVSERIKKRVNQWIGRTDFGSRLEPLPFRNGHEHSRFDAIFGDDLRTLFQRRFQKIA